MRTVAALALVGGVVGREDASLTANPIRKVVTMLQAMQKKVEAEGARDKELFDKFMCYCKTGVGGLEKDIGDANTKLPQLAASIESAESSVSTMKTELKQAQQDRADAKAAIAEATSLREKEAAEFSKVSTDLKTNIAAISKATKALDAGMGGAFLQTESAQTLKHLMTTAEMSDADRQDLGAFLSSSSGYSPASGEITGILKTMGDEMSADLKSATAEENGAVASYDELMKAKKKELVALNKEIEVKLGRIGELAVEIVQMKNDLTDTQEALVENTKFLKDLKKDCATKADEYQVIVKTRQEELLALADTIKLLNDDDALELFKKTLPGASALIQFTANSNSLRASALLHVQMAADRAFEGSPSLDFISLALKGKKIGFEKVVKLIDDLIGELKQDQVNDDSKKEYCASQFDIADDKKKSLTKSISDLETAIIEAKDGIVTLKDEISALEDGVKTLDKQVAEQTEQRKEEHEEFSELMSSNSAAKELLGFAKNRLNKFYNPKLYKPPSFLQISKHQQPEAPKAYKKQGEESNGVIAMIDALIADLEKEITESEVTEKDSQQDYEQAMADAKEKRASDSKALTEKQATQAELEGSLEDNTAQKKSDEKELMATEAYISSLHSECDFLLKYYDMRKESRAGEIDSLGKAKAVLAGADFSALIQTKKFLHKA